MADWLRISYIIQQLNDKLGGHFQILSLLCTLLSWLRKQSQSFAFRRDIEGSSVLLSRHPTDICRMKVRNDEWPGVFGLSHVPRLLIGMVLSLDQLGYNETTWSLSHVFCIYLVIGHRWTPPVQIKSN